MTNIIPKRLMNWISKYHRQCNIEYLEILATEIEMAGSRFIADFYDDYEPKYYHRNFGLYNAVHVEKYYNRANPAITISIRDDYMQNWYNDSTEYVFIGAIMLGYHGTSKIKVTKPSPFLRFDDYMTNYFSRADINRIKKFAQSRAMAKVGKPPIR